MSVKVSIFGIAGLFSLTVYAAEIDNKLPPIVDSAAKCKEALVGQNFNDSSVVSVDPIESIVRKVNGAYPDTRIELGHPVYRVTYRPDYDLNSLLNYFKGNRQYEMRSWDFQHLIETNIKAGRSQEAAVQNAEREMSVKLEQDLVQGDFGKWLYKQIAGTIVSSALVEKSGDAVPFALNSPSYALLYIKTQLTYFPPSDAAVRNPVILYKVQEQTPRGLSLNGMEYHILSYVPARDIAGAFVGNWDGDNISKWYFISIATRGPDGSAQVLKIFDVEKKGRDLNIVRELLTVNRTGIKKISSDLGLPSNLVVALSAF